MIPTVTMLLSPNYYATKTAFVDFKHRWAQFCTAVGTP